MNFWTDAPGSTPMGFDDFFEALISINIEPNGVQVSDFHSRIAQAKVQMLNNPEVSGWNIYSQWNFENHKTP